MEKNVLFTLIIGFICYPVAESQPCSLENGLIYDGKCFYFHDEIGISYETGIQRCQDDGATPANIYGTEHYNQLDALGRARNPLSSTYSLMTGMTFEHVNDIPRYYDGTDTTLPQELWAPNEPDDCGGICSIIYIDIDVSASSNYNGLYLFETSRGIDTHGVICEMDKFSIVTCTNLDPWGDANGDMTCTGNEHPSTCNFVCDPGWVLEGDEEINCQANGLWSDSGHNCRRGVCEEILPPNYGTRDCGEGDGIPTFEYETICNFDCSPGRYRVGAESSECGGDLQWTNTVPSCERVTCADPRIDNTGGSEHCTNFYFWGSECEARCFEGYNLVGEPVFCLGDSQLGYWDKSIPTCEIVTCTNLEPWDDANGDMTCTGNEYSNTCNFKCNIGWVLVGDEDITCQADGFWSDSGHQCRRLQCSLPTFDFSHGNQYCSKANNNGSICTTTCNNGYEADGWQTVICTQEELWSGPLPTMCEAVICDFSELSDGFNGKSIDCTTSPPYIPPASCSFICYPEQELISGASVVQCDGGNWIAQSGSAFPPTCAVVTCLPFSFPPGTVVCDPDDSIDHGTTCTFKCAEGYEPYPPGRTRTCQVTKNWSGTTPDTCNPVDCGAYGTILGGIARCEGGTTYQSECIAECNIGYEPKSTDASVCQANGDWSGPYLECIRVMCKPIPFDDQPGTKTCFPDTGYYYGTICKFECDDGHTLQGESQVKCEATGEWNPGPPTCKDIICPALSIEDGYLQCSYGRNYGSICRFFCNHPYQLYGADKTKCGLNEEWSEETPKCKLYDPKCEDAIVPESCDKDCDDKSDCDDDEVCCPSEECGYVCKKVKEEPTKRRFNLDPKLLAVIALAGRRPARRPVNPVCPACSGNACAVSRCQTFLNAACGTTCNGCVAHFISPLRIINGRFDLRYQMGARCQCPPGYPPNPTCGAWMCNGVGCATNPQAECRVYGCGQQCYLQFFDRFGHRVPCRQQATCQPGINSNGRCSPGCLRASCPANPSAHCRVTFARGQPQFYDQITNQAVNC